MHFIYFTILSAEGGKVRTASVLIVINTFVGGFLIKKFHSTNRRPALGMGAKAKDIPWEVEEKASLLGSPFPAGEK